MALHVLVSACFYPWWILVSFLEGMHIYSRGPGWGTDGQCMLGTLLSGAWNSPKWSLDLWQAKHGGQWRRILQHVLQRNQRWEARAPGYLCGPGAERCGYVFFANSRQMTQIQSYIVDIVTFWKSRLIRTLFIITEIIYIAISSWLFGKQSKELSWVRGEVRETVARCRKPRTTVSRVSSLLGDNSLTVSQVVTKELSRCHIYIIHDVIIIMSIVTLHKYK